MGKMLVTVMEIQILNILCSVGRASFPLLSMWKNSRHLQLLTYFLLTPLEGYISTFYFSQCFTNNQASFH